MTEKLFEQDAFMTAFTARVLACTPAAKGGYEVVLDRTAFFPEGGGQNADRGTLGGVHVLDTRNRGEDIVHLCDGPLACGETVTGTLDWDFRFDQMQQHSGEHLFSGLLHTLYGVENVGFHIGETEVTVDFDKPLTQQEILAGEALANRRIWENRPIIGYYPAPAELSALQYRSKKELEGPIRIVTIPDGDTCACCGTHLGTTGQIGMVKVLWHMNYKGGVRIGLACGGRALRDYHEKQEALRAIAVDLSAKLLQAPAAVQNLRQERDALRYRGDQLAQRVGELWPRGEITVVFEPAFTPQQMKKAVLSLQGKTRFAAGFCRAGDGWNFTLCSADVDVRPICRALCQTFGGRGGGKADLAQGSLAGGDAAQLEQTIMKGMQ